MPPVNKLLQNGAKLGINALKTGVTRPSPQTTAHIAQSTARMAAPNAPVGSRIGSATMSTFRASLREGAAEIRQKTAKKAVQYGNKFGEGVVHDVIAEVADVNGKSNKRPSAFGVGAGLVKKVAINEFQIAARNGAFTPSAETEDQLQNLGDRWHDEMKPD